MQNFKNNLSGSSYRDRTDTEVKLKSETNDKTLALNCFNCPKYTLIWSKCAWN
jgi:hypothetical protein